MTTTFHSTLELIEYAAGKIEMDAREAARNIHPLDRNRPMALRYGGIGAQIAAMAKCLRSGLDMTQKHALQLPLPVMVRMKDGKMFIEFDYISKVLSLFLDLSPVKEELVKLATALPNDAEKEPVH